MASQTIKVIGDLTSFVEGKIKVLTSTTAKTLEDATPELTGFAESNWVAKIGSAREEPSGSRQAVDFSALEAGIAIVQATYLLPQIVYISNPVSYINTLNTGSSTKAPKNFVQTAIAKSIKSVI